MNYTHVLIKAEGKTKDTALLGFAQDMLTLFPGEEGFYEFVVRSSLAVSNEGDCWFAHMYFSYRLNESLEGAMDNFNSDNLIPIKETN